MVLFNILTYLLHSKYIEKFLFCVHYLLLFLRKLGGKFSLKISGRSFVALCTKAASGLKLLRI